jgi:hypothetical protein
LKIKIKPIAILFASALALTAAAGSALATSPNGVDQNDVCGAEGQQDGDFKDAHCDKQDGDQNNVDEKDKNNVDEKDMNNVDEGQKGNDDGQNGNGQTGNNEGENEN